MITDEIKQFYDANGTPIDKMVSVGSSRLGLTPASIRQAAISVFNEIQNGEDIKPIRIAWRVFAVAKLLKSIAEQKENNRVAELEKENAALKAEIERRNLPFWKRLMGGGKKNAQ